MTASRALTWLWWVMSDRTTFNKPEHDRIASCTVHSDCWDERLLKRKRNGSSKDRVRPTRYSTCFVPTLALPFRTALSLSLGSMYFRAFAS